MSKPACIKAYHEMEERYSRLVLEYHSLEQKEQIFNASNEIIKKYKVYPTKIISPKGDFNGNFCLEFHDDYDKVSGTFFEELIKVLGVDHCELG
jgi:hypothetical protein